MTRAATATRLVPLPGCACPFCVRVLCTCLRVPCPCLCVCQPFCLDHQGLQARVLCLRAPIVRACPAPACACLPCACVWTCSISMSFTTRSSHECARPTLMNGRAASGGALAPEPQRVTCSQPESRDVRRRRVFARRRRTPTGSDQSHEDDANRGVSWNGME